VAKWRSGQAKFRNDYLIVFTKNRVIDKRILQLGAEVREPRHAFKLERRRLAGFIEIYPYQLFCVICSAIINSAKYIEKYPFNTQEFGRAMTNLRKTRKKGGSPTVKQRVWFWLVLVSLVFALVVPVCAAAMPQWEYLAAQVGRPLSGMSKPPAPTSPFITSDSLALREDPVLGPFLNTLGQQGWEMVSILSAQDGARMIFKRPYNEATAKADAEARAKEAKRIEEEYKVSLTTTPTVPTTSTTKLVDLDKQENDKRAADQLAKARTLVTNVVNEAVGTDGKVVKSFDVGSNMGGPMEGRIVVSGNLVVDATQKLLKPNSSYRSSEAQQLLDKIAGVIEEKLKPTEELPLVQMGNGIEIKVNGETVASNMGRTPPGMPGGLPNRPANPSVRIPNRPPTTPPNR
jgi:hypothetical protein